MFLNWSRVRWLLRYRGKQCAPAWWCAVPFWAVYAINRAQNSKPQLLKALVEGSLKTHSIILNSVCSFIVGPDWSNFAAKPKKMTHPVFIFRHAFPLCSGTLSNTAQQRSPFIFKGRSRAKLWEWGWEAGGCRSITTQRMVGEQAGQDSNSRVCKYYEWTGRLVEVSTISYTSKVIITESLNTILLNFFHVAYAFSAFVQWKSKQIRIQLRKLISF